MPVKVPGFTPTRRRVRFAGIVSRRRESAAVEGVDGGEGLRRRAFFVGDVFITVDVVEEERERVVRVVDGGWVMLVVVERDSEMLVSVLWRLRLAGLMEDSVGLLTECIN